jgi:hypothetical protein
MQSTGRTPISGPNGTGPDFGGRQDADDNKRETRKSLMLVVAKATDVTVKRAPLSNKGDLPHTRWAYHERIISGRRREE